MPGTLKAVLGVAGLFNLLYFVYPAPAGRGRRARGQIVVLRCSSTPRPWRPVRGLSLYDAIGSTNAEAWRARGLASAGRSGSPPGVRPRAAAGAAAAWVSEPGNLYASLLLTDPSPPARCSRTVVRRGARAARRYRRPHPAACRRGSR